MTTKQIKSLIELCNRHQCSIEFTACMTGVSVVACANRGDVSKQISIYLDRNDSEADEKLEKALKQISA